MRFSTDAAPMTPYRPLLGSLLVVSVLAAPSAFAAGPCNAACEALVEESARRWLREEEGVVDDITCVVLFLRAEESSVPEQLSSPASSTLASGGSQVWASQVEEEHAAFVTKLEHGLLLPRSSPSKERLPDMSP